MSPTFTGWFQPLTIREVWAHNFKIKEHIIANSAWGLLIIPLLPIAYFESICRENILDLKCLEMRCHHTSKLILLIKVNDSKIAILQISLSGRVIISYLVWYYSSLELILKVLKLYIALAKRNWIYAKNRSSHAPVVATILTCLSLWLFSALYSGKYIKSYYGLFSPVCFWTIRSLQ